MPDGYLPGVLPAVNGLDNIREVKTLINKYNNRHGPYFIAEWYPAWFDSWGDRHYVVPYQEFISTYDSVLSAGYSINIYMAHGGTTRWFWNGANMSRSDPYSPETSSYDYDAPIDEAGNATSKYMAMRDVIMKHLPEDIQLPVVPEPKRSMSLPGVKLSEFSSLFKNLPSPILVEYPLSLENYGQGYGYMLYRTTVHGPANGILKIQEMRSYRLVYLDGKRVAILDRRLRQDSIMLVVPEGIHLLEILVENNGRINYGSFLNDNKQGITEKVIFGGKVLTEWKMYGFPMTDKNMKKKRIKYATSGNIPEGPVFRRGTFTVDNPADTYIDMSEWGKGHVWINGKSAGKYWNIGPTQTIYVPAAWLNKGENEIMVIELIKPEQETVRFLDHPILDEVK